MLVAPSVMSTLMKSLYVEPAVSFRRKAAAKLSSVTPVAYWNDCDTPAAPTGRLPVPPGLLGGVALLVLSAAISHHCVPSSGMPLSAEMPEGLMTCPLPKVMLQGEAGEAPAVWDSKLPSLMPASRTWM